MCKIDVRPLLLFVFEPSGEPPDPPLQPPRASMTPTWNLQASKVDPLGVNNEPPGIKSEPLGIKNYLPDIKNTPLSIKNMFLNITKGVGGRGGSQ